MNYWEKTGADQLVTMGIATGNSVFGVYQGGDRLFVKTVNVMPYTRMYMPEKSDYGFLLPEGMKAEVLSRYPCIQMSDGNILCNAACSVATLVSEDFKKQELYVLFDGSRNGRLIYVYDLLKGSWESLYPGGGFPYSEIVLAR